MDNSVQNSWNTKQVYTLSVICLVLGGVVGYIMGAPSSISADNKQMPPAISQQPPTINPQMDTAMPGQSVPLTPDAMKSYADKQAEPLLSTLKSRPNDAKLLANIGAVYFAAHQFRTAQEYYARSAKIDNKNPAILVKLSSAYYYTGNSKSAITTLNQALQLDPRNADALFNLGVLDMQVKSDPKSAIALWEKLLEYNPDHPNRAQVEQMIERARMQMNIDAGKGNS